MYNAIVSGTGSYVPEKRLTNADLEKMVETNDEWIVTRTGISERRVTEESESTSDLAYVAAKLAIEDAGLTAEDIDLIVVGTVTPDYQFPSVACQLQERLGCREVGSFDVNATCVGFVTALQVAEMYVKLGKHKHVLVVGADTLSKITDYTDRSTCILFGDGAGAFVLSRTDQFIENEGIIYSSIHSKGEHLEGLYVPNGGSRNPKNNTAEGPGIVMDGRKIFKLAVQSMSKTVTETLEASGYQKEQIDWIIPHQANQRIIEAVANQLNYPLEKVISTIKYYGNNSSATIPLAFDLSVKSGKIKRGDLVMQTAFGGGLVWGSLLMKY
ncbi:beta-ketoacyl-ACP synthase III [Bacillus alkalicellulosilyticus]|uniref:beta-ketoacyl-ACP synthase III n=1 Tax=Alkalihalobacterium alkalicellulosilyticum TaxID=1912214 RepID=UPI000997518B|nr:beta-ketoacyl-ACP synthase III [Bacillus alkalicellulosilyticus]